MGSEFAEAPWPEKLITLGLILAVASGVIGLVIGIVVFVTSVVQGLGTKPNTIEPAAYRSEQERLRRSAKEGLPRDVAWPAYVRRQVFADLAQVRATWQARYQRLWKGAVDAFFRGHTESPLGWWFFFPIPVGTIVALSAAGVVMLACFILFATIVLLYAFFGHCAFAVTTYALRSLEWLWTRLRGAEASCPACYYVSPRPAYKCPGCSALHRDVRPGTLGVVVRRCDCGTVIPTMVLRAAWRMTAVCQRCEEPVRLGAAVAREIRIPIVGDVGAGKTRYLYAALDSLIATAEQGGIDVTFSDGDSHTRAQRGLELIRSSADTNKTSEALPLAFTCRLGSGATSTLIHLFDVAGERFHDAASHDAMGFLETGHGLVYVLDPFSIRTVRDQLDGNFQAAASLARAARRDPDGTYGEVMQRLRSGGIKARSQRLAVVVSKSDLLAQWGLGLPTDGDKLAGWLHDVGVHNLVLAAKNEFAEVRYFAVASLLATRTIPETDPGAPLRWLLQTRGVRLPAEPLAVSGRAR